MTTAQKNEKRLKALGNAATATQSMKFFKTGPGEYGEGDLFIGIKSPILRKLAKELVNSPTPAHGHPSAGGDFSKSPPAEGCAKRGVGIVGISLEDTVELLQSPIHEARTLALFIMVLQAKRGDSTLPLYRAYLANTAKINNWDLVDVTAEHIIGKHLFDRSRKPLYKLAKSKSLWERRIAIIATFHFIRKNDFDDTLALADLLLNDPEDLMHKAVGWMLREVGNRDLAIEEAFLLPRYKQMPRTMLRYAIERFPEPKRLVYLHGNA